MLFFASLLATTAFVACGDSSSAESDPSTETKDAKDTFVDSRDGQTYKIVTIGTQTWMVQNLNFKTDSSYCYGDEEKNCDKYGRLYTWAAAVGKAEDECGRARECNLPPGHVQGVCPEGWHLPSKVEWETLFAAVGGEYTAAKVLKSISGWKDNGNGTDDVGFFVLPAGNGTRRQNLDKEEWYRGEGYSADFWSATEDIGEEIRAYEVTLHSEHDDASLGGDAKDLLASVRCLKSEVSSPSDVVLASPCKTDQEDTCVYGELTDFDGQTYKTVTIGTQTWMAENLNYDADGSYCYNDDTTNCSKYGRLYTWMTAIGYVSDSSSSRIYNLPSGLVQGVCPSGWHLPSKAEWETLFAAVGGALTAGEVLKSMSDWDSRGKGTDIFGFSALPAGYKKVYDGFFGRNGESEYDGSCAYFWSVTENLNDYAAQYAYGACLSYGNGDAYLYYDNKGDAFSVRCLKDDEKTTVANPLRDVALASPCKTDQVDTCVYGELTDSRDSQTYKTVSIGTQTWMAENLNYEMDDSYCFNDDTINCAKYGRLYGADAAMATVCPSGWHLPDWVEWEILIAAVGRISKTAGGMLKSQTGWDFDRNGTDAFGFSAIPAGRRSLGYKNSEFSAFFWSSEKNGIMLEYELSSVIYRYEVWVPYEKSSGAAYSVRCIQD